MWITWLIWIEGLNFDFPWSLDTQTWPPSWAPVLYDSLMHQHVQQVVSHSHYIICTCTRHELLTWAKELFKLLFRVSRITAVLSNFSTTSLSTPIGFQQCCWITQTRMKSGREEDFETAVKTHFSQRGSSFPSTFVHSYLKFHVPIWLHMFTVVTDLCIAKILLFCMDWPIKHPLLCAFVFLHSNDHT